MQNEVSLPKMLMLGTLELLLNQALESQPEAQSLLRELDRVVVRIRTERPFTVIYLLICQDGIEILHDYEGHVDIRIRAPLGALLYHMLKTGEDIPDSIRILADEDQLESVRTLMQACNLWQVTQVWLHEHIQLEQLLVSLRRFDPDWFDKLHHLHEEMQQIRSIIDHQQEVQIQILAELKSLRHSLRRERKMDIICLTLAVIFFVGAIANASGLLEQYLPSSEMATTTLVLVATGLTLVFSRIFFGHRYD